MRQVRTSAALEISVLIAAIALMVFVWSKNDRRGLANLSQDEIVEWQIRLLGP